MPNTKRTRPLPGNPVHYPTVRQLQKLFDSAPDLICTTDTEGRWVHINQAAFTLLGYRPEELIGHICAEHVVPEDRKRTEEMQTQIRSNSDGATFENRYYRKDGSIIPLIWSARWDAEEQLFFCIAKDASQLKATEEELRKYSMIVHQTKNMVILTDANGRITWVNEAFNRITGYTLDEAIGHKPGDLLQGPESDPAVIRNMAKKIKKGEPFVAELLNYTKSQQPYWIEIYCQPVYDADGKLQQFFAIQADITERKKLQAQLEEELRKRQQIITAAAIKAQEKERAQVGRELHDNVNQVLTTVKLYIEMCRDDMGNTQEIMDRSIKLLQDSINEIRSLSKRLSAPSLGSIKLRDSIQELIDSISATNRIAIDLDMSNIKDLEVNQELHLAIYRILQEHLTNILKHAQAEQVHISFDFVDGDLTLKVIDNGRGFNTAIKRNGIGIANMTTRAESLKGSLVLNSAPGLGCVLIARFPME